MGILKPHLISKTLGVCMYVYKPMTSNSSPLNSRVIYPSANWTSISPLMSLGNQCPKDSSGFPLQNLLLVSLPFQEKVFSSSNG